MECYYDAAPGATPDVTAHANDDAALMLDYLFGPRCLPLDRQASIDSEHLVDLKFPIILTRLSNLGSTLTLQIYPEAAMAPTWRLERGYPIPDGTSIAGRCALRCFLAMMKWQESIHLCGRSRTAGRESTERKYSLHDHLVKSMAAVKEARRHREFERQCRHVSLTIDWGAKEATLRFAGERRLRGQTWKY